MTRCWPYRPLAVASAALVACSPGDRGALEPVAGPGMALASTHGLPNDTARIEVGGVRVDVTGAWSNTGVSVEVVYRAGAAPALIPAASSARWNGRSVAADRMYDRTAPEPGDVVGRPLIGTSGLSVSPTRRATVLIFYDAPQGVDPPAHGDTVSIDVPMPGGSRPATFKAGSE